jgi:hypothetical protein
MELTVDLIEWTGRSLIAHRRLDRLVPDHALLADVTHQPFHRAAGNIAALTLHLLPYLAYTIDLEVGVKYMLDIGLHRLVALRAWRQPRRIAALCHTLMVIGWGANRLYRISTTMLINPAAASGALRL